MKTLIILFLMLGLAACACKPTPEPTAPVTATRPVGQKLAVTLQAHVLADGKIEEVKVEQSSGSAEIDQKAVELVKNGKASPAMQDGKPVDSWVSKTLEFEKVVQPNSK